MMLVVRNMPKDSDRRFYGFLKDAWPAINYQLLKHYRGFTFETHFDCDIKDRHKPA